MRLFFVLAALLVSSVWAQPYTVVGVSDGDTVRVLNADKQEFKCRLHGIDAPEKKPGVRSSIKAIWLFVPIPSKR